MRAYRKYENIKQEQSSSASLDFYKSRFLIVAHIVLISIMFAFLANINKTMKTQEQNNKAFYEAVAAGTTFSGNMSSTCQSSYSFELVKRFKTYNDVLFYAFVASALYNLVYIAFATTLPSSKWTLFWIYGPLAVMGIVGVGLSVDGYVKIRSLNREPLACQRMFDHYKSFFIVAMTASVIQAFFSIWILTPLFIKS